MPHITSLLDSHDGIALSQLLHQGEISAAELLQAMWQRMDERNPALNAIAQRFDEQAMQHAHAWQQQMRHSPTPPSPLSGVPIVMKDLLADMAGLPTRSGSASYRALPIPAQDAEITRRYRAAGLIPAAKTTLPEWGLVPYTESDLYGTTRNPWDTSRTPGGSSGGAGAALAARMTPLAHGGDGGGSIRIPASNCGLFGLKPGRGRNPLSPGVTEVWQGFVVEHALTRSVRDSAALLDILCQPWPAPDADWRSPLYHITPAPASGFLAALQQPVPRLRVAVSLKPFTGGAVHPEVCQAVEHTATLLQSLGHTVEHAHPSIASPDTLKRIMEIIVAASAAHMAHEWGIISGRPLHWRDVEPATWALIQHGRHIRADDMLWARETALRQGSIMEQFHQQWDVLLTPTLNQPAAPIGSLAVPETQAALSRLFVGRLGMNWLLRLSPLVQQGLDRLMHYMGWPVLANMTGQPAMSVPLHWSTPTPSAPAGLPIGCMFTARMGDEVTLLQLAHQLEQAQPWWDNNPHTASPPTVNRDI